MKEEKTINRRTCVVGVEALEKPANEFDELLDDIHLTLNAKDMRPERRANRFLQLLAFVLGCGSHAVVYVHVGNVGKGK